MYGQLVRPPREFIAAAQPYVCARVTDMANVDLEVFRFDFDLTLAILLMHPDGTVYHRWGSRDADAADAWMSLPHLTQLLRDTLEEHRRYDPTSADDDDTLRRGHTVLDLPPLQRKIAKGQQPACIHCHTVHDTEHRWAVEQDTWRRDDLWIYPPPERVGLQLRRDDPALVRDITADSPAAEAGLRAGDRLLHIGVQARVGTRADVAFALHRAPAAETTLPLAYTRGGQPRDTVLELPEGWKRGTPETYAWRPYKWNLSPAPGFGGQVLDPAAKRALGLAQAPFALRVDYLVTWGERAQRGRAAAAAGLRKGDIVLSFAGKDDFNSSEHFHAWARLTRRVGETVTVVLQRRGQRRTLSYALPE